MRIKIGIGLVTLTLFYLIGVNFLYFLLVLALCFLVALYIFQGKILYMPSIPGLPLSPSENPIGFRHPSEQGLNTQNVEITTVDQIILKGWLVMPNGIQTKRLIVFFHENAGNIGARIDYIKQLCQVTRSDVLLVAYRGYSDSTGKPSEKGLQMDASAIMEYALQYSKQKSKQIFVLGKSLGGAVSIFVLSQLPCASSVRGLILENTFTCISAMIDALIPLLRYFKLLNRNKWPSIDRIGKIKCPIMFIRSQYDEIVPPKQMVELLKIASTSSSYVKDYLIREATHNGAQEMDNKYFSKINEFLDAVHDMP